MAKQKQIGRTKVFSISTKVIQYIFQESVATNGGSKIRATIERLNNTYQIVIRDATEDDVDTFYASLELLLDVQVSRRFIPKSN